MTPGNTVVLVSRRYLDVPFLHQGRDKKLGVDCVGLLICVGQDLGLDIQASSDYSMLPQGKKLIEEIKKNGCIEIPVEQAMPGDIMVFWLSKREVGIEQHAAILTEKGMLHALNSRGGSGKVVEHEFTENWKRRLMSVWRYQWQ